MVDEPDWKEIFEVAASQRDEATRNLHNLQINMTILQKKNEKLEERIKELLDTGAIAHVNGKDKENMEFSFSVEEDNIPVKGSKNAR